MPIQKIAQESEDDNSDYDDIEELTLDDDDGDDVTLPDLMQTFFAGENNKNIVDTLESLKSSVDTQNKILMKICSSLETHFSNTSSS
jgi:hypothetical protein